MKQEKKTEEETNEDAQVEGFLITAEEVAGLNNKTFEISEVPEYRDFPDFQDKSKTVRRIVITATLANGTKAEWIPNKKSQQKIISERGRSLRDWVNFKGEWTTKEQVIAGKEKLVIYLK